MPPDADAPRMGEGLYTLPDVAHILRLPSSTVRRWANGYWRWHDETERRRLPAVTDTGKWRVRQARVMNFLALVEMYTFVTLRERGVRLPQIRQAHGELRRRYGGDYPFALHPVLSDGHSVLLRLEETAALNLNESGQTEFVSLIAPFLVKLEFDRSTELAGRFWPLGRDRAVVVDPRRGYGRPTVAGTRVTTEIIQALRRGGASVAHIADRYDLSRQAVRDAIAFEEGAA